MSRRLCRSNFAAPVICAVIAFVIDATAAGASAAAQMKAPSNTSAVGVSESRADVSWQDNSTNEAGSSSLHGGADRKLQRVGDDRRQHDELCGRGDRRVDAILLQAPRIQHDQRQDTLL